MDGNTVTPTFEQSIAIEIGSLHMEVLRLRALLAERDARLAELARKTSQDAS